jgi:ketosteroid isomerase-like protein
MKYLSVNALLIAGILLISGCGPKGDSPEKMIAEAKALDQRFFDAYNKGDVDAIMATYWNSPDLVSFPPGAMMAKGFEAVRQGMLKEFSGPRGKLELVDANYKVAGDIVYCWGTWRWTMAPPEGPPIEVLGRYSDIKAKRDGKWVFVMDHASAPMPPPPDQKPVN